VKKSKTFSSKRHKNLLKILKKAQTLWKLYTVLKSFRSFYRLVKEHLEPLIKYFEIFSDYFRSIWKVSREFEKP